MKNLIITACISLLSIGAFAGTTAKADVQTTQSAVSNAVSGKVIDKKTNEALAGVAVVANGQKVYTDFDGNFTITNLCGENCQLSISLISYETQTLAVSLDQTQTLDVSLSQR